jgi:GrpB-like predicted nucleotidyltransferase (UPF0157 family)
MTRLVASGDGAEMEAKLKEVVIGGPTELPPEGIVLEPYNAAWPVMFEQLAARVRDVLGDRVLLLEHIGSTAVPGLSAKPIIDVVLAVADPGDEAAYVPQLESAGFVLRVREPSWHQHRLLKHGDPVCNLHVFPAGCPEIRRDLLFRDRLRSVPEERGAYEREKLALVKRRWRYMQQYADAKSDIVEAIIARAEQAP